MEKIRANQVRGANRAAVLRLLHRFPQLSRAELSRRTGLSEGTVSRIAADLLRECLITEQGAENSTGGRPGTRLELDRTHYRGAGVEIHEWETRICFGTLNGSILESQSFRTPPSALKTLDEVAVRCQKYAASHGEERFEGVGIAVRGIVDNDSGVVELGSPREWTGIPIKEYLGERLGFAVHVENNVRAAALAEYNRGNSEVNSSRCLVYLKVDEGVGTGIVMNGRLYRGPHKAAGEFGQMVVADSSGIGCEDRPGCLESLTSNIAICSHYAELTGSERKLRAAETDARVRRIASLAMAGDVFARRAISHCCRYLGIGIANIVWALDAEVIVVDGAITEAWPLVASVLQEQLPLGRDLVNFKDLVVRPCALGDQATISGALALPFARLFATGQRGRAPVKALSQWA
jgi:predicted NBD/HSP70 family sugar kinase